jgi:TnpA family transposase
VAAAGPALGDGRESAYNLRVESPAQTRFRTTLKGNRFAQSPREKWMPRRNLLTDAQRSLFWLPPTDERSLVRHYTLAPEDLELVNRRRRAANRLGFALMLCYLRYPGRVLERSERPPEPLLRFVAQQLGVDARR